MRKSGNCDIDLLVLDNLGSFGDSIYEGMVGTDGPTIINFGDTFVADHTIQAGSGMDAFFILISLWTIAGPISMLLKENSLF